MFWFRYIFRKKRRKGRIIRRLGSVSTWKSISFFSSSGRDGWTPASVDKGNIIPPKNQIVSWKGTRPTNKNSLSTIIFHWGTLGFSRESSIFAFRYGLKSFTVFDNVHHFSHREYDSWITYSKLICSSMTAEHCKHCSILLRLCNNNSSTSTSSWSNWKMRRSIWIIWTGSSPKRNKSRKPMEK